jgi:hypothetical protein
MKKIIFLLFSFSFKRGVSLKSVRSCSQTLVGRDGGGSKLVHSLLFAIFAVSSILTDKIYKTKYALKMIFLKSNLLKNEVLSTENEKVVFSSLSECARLPSRPPDVRVARQSQPRYTAS